jgi:DNA modification methylase
MSGVILINANSLHIPLADKSVQMCVTSPPYFSLRDYGTARWIGGDPNCNHTKDRAAGIQTSTLQGGKSTTNHQQEAAYRGVCGKCGAMRVDDQIGLETSPTEFVEKLVQVFREVKRVLRDDGVLWLNLGDSYNGSGGAGGDYNAGGLREGQPRYPGHRVDGLKPKDLIGIPWRVAFALQEDGWYLRSDIIWAKPNPMPESVTDRPTKAHEYLFLLAKNEKYFYDADAVREPHQVESLERFERGGSFVNGRTDGAPYQMQHSPRGHTSGRNRRTVWTIATAPYSGAHFATYPPALVEPCIKAGSRIGDIVLDPFAGSGTTLQVARELGRHGIGLDLSYTYLHDQARTRLDLAALDAWTNGIQVETPADLGPLFSGM